MWDIKYRPAVFSDVLGQEGSIQVLRARLRENKAFDTSYVFAGGHGCGKTTLARILARAMLCTNLTAEGDPCNECEHCKACMSESMVAFNELNAASQGTTADMRQLVEDNAYSLPGIPKRIYVLDEAHRMSKDAQDVLLKPIEDKQMVVILCTTELPKIRSTISSRCEIYEIRRIDRMDILKRMKMILESEGVPYEDDAVLTVIDIANGHVRDAVNKLETVAQLGPITVESVRERLNLSVVSTYYEILLSLGDPSKAVQLAEEACNRVGPSEVVSGLAEAAMNSYRHAHKIYADFAIFDREAAEKTYALLGDTLPRLAQYFLRNAYPTKLNVVCDVVTLCETGGKASVETAQVVSTPPVLVQVQTISAPQQAPPSTAPTAPSEPPPAKTEAVKPEASKEKPPSTPPKTIPPSDPTRQKNVRSDGIGPKGSSDPFALGDQDHKAVPTEYPRGHNTKAPPPRKKVNGNGDVRPLTPPEVTIRLNELRFRKRV